MPSTFKSSLPLTATSFVNKSGAIGLSLVPMILIDRHFGTAESSAILGASRAAALIGAFIGGAACDRWGARAVIISSFALSAIGLAGLPFLTTLPLLVSAVVIAELGTSFFNSPARMLLNRMVGKGQFQEAVAWLRTANNLGQVVSYTFGALFSAFGTTFLILFDSGTSFCAAVFGYRNLPEISPEADVLAPLAPRETRPRARPWRRQFAVCTTVVFGMSFLYELFMVSSAARYRLLYGAEGLRIYSAMMVVNTLLCAGLAVLAARYFKQPRTALGLGLALVGAGSAMAIAWARNAPWIFAGMFVMTLGEIIFSSLSQVLLIRTIPGGRRSGSIYGIALTLQGVGKILAAILAFPWVVEGPTPERVFLLAPLPFIALAFFVHETE